MKTRNLGKTGLSVSVIGVGTWQFGGEWGKDYNQAEVDAILDTAHECGINLIDTAECYGDHLSERMIGDYLRRRNREEWIVATKFGHFFHAFLSRTDAFQADRVRHQLDASLKALKTDFIDLYQFHSGPDEAFHNDRLWTVLEKEKQAGKIRFLGCSLNKSTLIQAEDAPLYGVEVIQVLYNRLDRTAEEMHFPAAEKHHLGVLARVPLASGLLTGKYHPGHRFEANDVRFRMDDKVLDQQLTEVEAVLVEEIPQGMDPAQWAIAWCLRDRRVTAVIPGCKDPDQVMRNAGAARLIA